MKAGTFAAPSIDRLEEIAPFVVKLRIAKGGSQTALAKRLGVTKQVVSRSEEDEYQGVSIARLQEILDALGVKARIRLSA